MAVVMGLENARCTLCERLFSHLHGLHPLLRADVLEALSMEGKLLHRPASPLDGRWALLPFYLARDLRAPIEPDPACDAALAMECVVCATDLLDDVMDDDMTPLIEQLGTARALNTALALISLAQHILLALPNLDCPAILPTRLLDAVQSAMLLASAGQQRDLLAERRPACDLSREECIEIAAAKAGSLLSLACRMGALCAGLEIERVEQCAELGRLLGIAAQLDNDAHDLYHLLRPVAQTGRGQKSDLVRAKKTLPVVLAAHTLRATHALDAAHLDFRHVFSRAEDREREICLNALKEGILTTWGIALLYRERAREHLDLLMGSRSASPVLCRVLGLEQALARVAD